MSHEATVGFVEITLAVALFIMSAIIIKYSDHVGSKYPEKDKEIHSKLWKIIYTFSILGILLLISGIFTFLRGQNTNDGKFNITIYDGERSVTYEDITNFNKLNAEIKFTTKEGKRKYIYLNNYMTYEMEEVD